MRNGGGDDASREAADTYVAGLEKVSSAGHFTLQLMESEPTVRHTGVYTWQLNVLGADDEPMTGLSILAEPTMPNHGHGTEPRYTEGTAADADGLYQLKDMNLYMDGLWNVMIRISSEDGVEDEAGFSFSLKRTLILRLSVLSLYLGCGSPNDIQGPSPSGPLVNPRIGH